MDLSVIFLDKKLIALVKMQTRLAKPMLMEVRMARNGLDINMIISRGAQLVNEVGLENITLKMIAEDLGVKTPSLYNHITGLEELKMQLMLYGWKQMEQRIMQSVIGVSGYDAIRAGCYAFYEYAIENPGLFNVMLWYNKFQNRETMEVTSGLFSILFKITSSLNIYADYAKWLSFRCQTVRKLKSIEHDDSESHLPKIQSAARSVPLLPPQTYLYRELSVFGQYQTSSGN